MSHKHNSSSLPLPVTLTMQPTVEDLCCNTAFQNAPLMTPAQPQQVSNRVETRQLSCPASTAGSNFRCCPITPLCHFTVTHFFSLLIFVSGHRPAHSCFFFFFLPQLSVHPGCEAGKHSGACTDSSSSPSPSGSLPHTASALYSQCPHPQETEKVPSQLEVFSCRLNKWARVRARTSKRAARVQMLQLSSTLPAHVVVSEPPQGNRTSNAPC